GPRFSVPNRDRNRLRARFADPIGGILITADQTEPVRNEARASGYRVLHKPLKPAALRALLSRLVSVRERDQAPRAG
ncbi:MAG: hypothetical protein ACOCVP_08305, partial [Wenzhouxiangella sp.]